MNIVTGPFSCQVARKSDHAALAGTVSDRLEFRGEPTIPAIEATLMIFPRFCPIMTLPTACEHRNVRLDSFPDLVPLLQTHFFRGSSPGSSRVVDQRYRFARTV